MHSIASIYRFNTPFLDISNEKDNLINVLTKIKQSLKFDWIIFNEKKELIGNYYKITLIFQNNLWKIEFFYIDSITEFYLPIFKLNIFVNNNFLVWKNKEKTVKFLTNIFECFDWLNEKEYLIDLDVNIYYLKWLFKVRKYPHYDFSNLNKIRNDFEEKKWLELLTDFINRFKNKDYILTKENSKEYHKLHWILLYFIYLVFLMYQNLEKSSIAKKELETVENTWIYEWQINLMKQRLKYVDDLNILTFNKYKDRLESFFSLFN